MGEGALLNTRHLLVVTRASSATADNGSLSYGTALLCIKPPLLLNRVRERFQEQVPGFSFRQTADDMEYKSLELPSLQPKADPNSDFITMFDQQRNATIIATPSTEGVHR